jgi:methyltransferase (TIGR00027 family)
VKFYELDHPATQELKINRVREVLRSIPSTVRYVPIDFTKDSLLTQLLRSGYSETERSFFVWEGVVHYIPAAAVRDTLRFVATHSGPGSQIIFDYPFATNRRINNPDDLFARWGEPFLFGFPPGGPGAMVREVGLRLVSDFSNSEVARRYAVRPDGSSSLRIPDPGTNGDLDDAGFAIAERPVGGVQ